MEKEQLIPLPEDYKTFFETVKKDKLFDSIMVNVIRARQNNALNAENAELKKQVEELKG